MEDEISYTDIQAEKKLQRQLASERRTVLEAQIEQDEHPLTAETDKQPERNLLKRDMKRIALTRLEDAARTQADFEKVLEMWDKLDANRERKERYHEILRSGSDIPLDYGAARENLYFPQTMNRVLMKETRKGNFIDVIYYCPFEIHELVTADYISDILKDLKDEQKELLFQLVVCQYRTARVAAIRKQSDRNIRKIRITLLKKLRKRITVALQERIASNLPLTLEERVFLEDMEGCNENLF